MGEKRTGRTVTCLGLEFPQEISEASDIRQPLISPLYWNPCFLKETWLLSFSKRVCSSFNVVADDTFLQYGSYGVTGRLHPSHRAVWGAPCCNIFVHVVLPGSQGYGRSRLTDLSEEIRNVKHDNRLLPSQEVITVTGSKVRYYLTFLHRYQRVTSHYKPVKCCTCRRYSIGADAGTRSTQPGNTRRLGRAMQRVQGTDRRPEGHIWSSHCIQGGLPSR